jgi:hypothetical protein
MVILLTRRFPPLIILIAVCALPPEAHGWMTKPKAEKYVKDVIRTDFGRGTALASRASSRCRFVGTSLGDYKVFRCSFRVSFDAFRYRGSARVYPFRPEGNPETLYTLAYRWHQAGAEISPADRHIPAPTPTRSRPAT